MTRERAIYAGLAALLLIAFFSPWITLDLLFTRHTVSGAALPGQIRAVVQAAESVSVAFTGQRSGAGLWTLLAYVLYLIPLAALNLLARSVTSRAGRGAAVLTGAITLALGALTLLIVTQTVGRDGVGLLAGGYWSTLLLGAGLLAAAFALPRTHQPVLTSKQRAALGDRTRQAATQASTWVADQQTKLTQHTEQRRIEQALGRTIDRSLLAADDTVVAHAGDLITHDLVQRARQAGLLPALLGSVTHTPATPVSTKR